MKSLCPYNCTPNPCDAMHIGLGFASAFLPGNWGGVVAGGFAGYELLRSKPGVDRVRSLAQYGLGFLAARAVREMGGG
jgi:hypothetical protein